MLQNLGGGIPGAASATIFATPLRYAACFGENVEHSPSESLALAQGYTPEDDAITCVMVESPRLCFDDVSEEPVRLLAGIADSMTALGSWNMHARSDMVVAMGPQHAAVCARAGLGRRDVHRWLVERAGRTVGDLKRGGNWPARWTSRSRPSAGEGPARCARPDTPRSPCHTRSAAFPPGCYVR